MSEQMPTVTTQELELAGGGPHDGMTMSVTSGRDVVMAITFTVDPEDGWDYQIAKGEGSPPYFPHVVNVLRSLADALEAEASHE